MIEEKALKLAEYDGWVKTQDLNFIDNNNHIQNLWINDKLNKDEKGITTWLIKEYSSFDKLIELVNNLNKENNYEIITNRQFVILKEGESMLNNNYTREIYCNFYHYQNIDKIKEGIMVCLIKYYELMKRDTCNER